MARGKTLGLLLNGLRAECRLSLNPAHNNQDRDAQIELLQRWQEALWEDYDWPHLRVQRTLTVQAGQRYYEPPEDIAIDRIEKIEFRFGTEWCALHYGIEAGHYAAFDSDADIYSWPVTRWRIYEEDQIELWPVPSDDTDGLEGQLRITGIRKLQPLVADTDRADIDDRLIILNAAAERLAARGEKDAKLKLDLATRRLLTLRGNSTKRRRFSIGFGGTAGYRHNAHIPRIHYRDRETS